MKCPRCNENSERYAAATLIGSDHATVTWRRNCICGNTFTTIERRVSYKHKGVRFDVCIGDDEPGARKS